MDADIRYKILGGLIGGGIGFLAGSIICDLYFPEYEEVNPNVEGEEALSVSARKRPDYYDRRPKPDSEVVKTNKPLAATADKKSLIPYHNLGIMADFDKDVEALVVEEEPTVQLDIYVIPKDEYGNMEQYPAIELTYFAYDDTLLDPSGQPIDEVADVIGEDSLELFGQESEDADTVYIRNEILGYDYQISRINGTKPKSKPLHVDQVVDPATDDLIDDELAIPGSRVHKRLVTSVQGKRVIKKTKDEDGEHR